eukprot:629497-Amphidinium_carterae.1
MMRAGEAAARQKRVAKKTRKRKTSNENPSQFKTKKMNDDFKKNNVNKKNWNYRDTQRNKEYRTKSCSCDRSTSRSAWNATNTSRRDRRTCNINTQLNSEKYKHVRTDIITFIEHKEITDDRR